MSKEFYAPGLMDLSGYHLDIVEDDAWDKFVKKSKQGTIFNSSLFLKALDEPIKKWGCYKGSELKGAICTAETTTALTGSNSKEKQESFGMIRPKLSIYNGFMLQPADAQQAKANQFAEEFRTISAMTKSLTDRYVSLQFQTHYSLQDLRPLLWHNYGTDQKKITCTPRFTSTISFAERYPENAALDKNPLYQQCSKSRRQEIRYAISKSVQIEKKLDLKLFQDLYRMTFERQGLAVDEAQLEQIKQVCSALHEQHQLSMYIASDGEGNVGSIAIFAHDQKCAYYLYGANSQVAKKSHTGSYVIFYACNDLLKNGLPEIDLEGVNSPARGHFKLSFGGQLKTYYSVSM